MISVCHEHIVFRSCVNGRWLIHPTFLAAYGWGSPIRFVFDRYSNDQKLAIFVPWQGNSNLPTFTSIRAKLERQTSVAWFNNPGQTVQIRQNMNDIVVPYVEFDLENGEISVDWRALYTSYLTEERLYARAYIDEVLMSLNLYLRRLETRV